MTLINLNSVWVNKIEPGFVNRVTVQRMSLCYVCCPGTPRLEQMRNVREFISPKVVEVSSMFIWFPSSVTVLMNFHSENVNYLYGVKNEYQKRRQTCSIKHNELRLLSFIYSLKTFNFTLVVNCCSILIHLY